MNSRTRAYILLHILLAVYSLTSVFSKLAAQEEFLSLRFCLYYGAMILLLGVYAIGWQQVIKRLPLTEAFANKAVTVLWGFIYGIILFHEGVTIWKLVGLALIITGIVLYARSDPGEDEA
ncbi:MAG: transporter [Solobacterium sp.]|nr:transporter [Solobacterium sp.]